RLPVLGGWNSAADHHSSYHSHRNADDAEANRRDPLSERCCPSRMLLFGAGRNSPGRFAWLPRRQRRCRSRGSLFLRGADDLSARKARLVEERRTAVAGRLKCFANPLQLPPKLASGAEALRRILGERAVHRGNELRRQVRHETFKRRRVLVKDLHDDCSWRLRLERLASGEQLVQHNSCREDVRAAVYTVAA